MRSQWGPLWGAATVVLMTVAGCGSTRSEGLGGDTHWLAGCVVDDDCGRGSCLCGLCSEACEGDARCEGGQRAACFDVRSPGVQQTCPSAGLERGGICLALCENETDCAAGQRCHDGACVSAPASTVTTQGDVGNEPSTGDADALERRPTRASEYAGLEPAVSFDTPVAVPTPAFVFEGEAESLLGVWRTTPADACSENSVAYCLRIVIEPMEGTGEITGYVTWDGPAGGDNPKGPFPAASDPDRGYPQSVEARDYITLIHHHRRADARFTMLDARFDGELLRFWYTPLELWSDWCAMQTSYAVPDGTPPYRCVPEGASEADPPVDPGKLELCTFEFPICHCDAEGCALDWHSQRIILVISVRGDAMQVISWPVQSAGSLGGPLDLVREVEP